MNLSYLWLVLIIGAAAILWVRAWWRHLVKGKAARAQQEIAFAQSDAVLAAQLDAIIAEQHRYQGAHLAVNARPYQQAQTGQKSVITWYATGIEQDTWFQGAWPEAGALLLVSGHTNYGPHNHNPNVFYVLPGHIRGWVPAEAHWAWIRNSQRQQGIYRR